MAKFKYKAMNSHGERLAGSYEGNSKEDVISMISANNMYLLELEEVYGSKEINLRTSRRVKTKDLVVFCRQFYVMINAGLTINTALDILSNQVSNLKLRETLKNVSEDVQKGDTLSNSMKKYSDVFPNLLVKMVESGEASGALETIMLRMAKYYEKENKINNKVKSAMIYPIILSIVAIGVLILMMVKVVPMFVDMFQQNNTKLPLITRALLAISGFITSYWIFIIIVLTAAIGGFIYYKNTEEGAYNVSKIALKLPIIRELIKKIIVSRFTRTLSTLLSSGISLVDSIRIVAGVVNNKVAEEGLIKISEDVVKGEGLYGPIKANNLFPPMLSSMIKIGEESGTLDDILDKTADFYDDELDLAITSGTAMLEPLMIIVMGVVVAFIVFAIMLPMFDMYNQI